MQIKCNYTLGRAGPGWEGDRGSSGSASNSETDRPSWLLIQHSQVFYSFAVVPCHQLSSARLGSAQHWQGVDKSSRSKREKKSINILKKYSNKED